jgi:hypothetical protein
VTVLTEATGFSRRTVLRVIASCENLQYIRVIRERKDNGTNMSNRYDLRPLKLLKLVPERSKKEQKALLQTGKAKRSTPKKEKQYGITAINRLRPQVAEALRFRCTGATYRQQDEANGLKTPSPWEPTDLELAEAKEAVEGSEMASIVEEHPEMLPHEMGDWLVERRMKSPLSGWSPPGRSSAPHPHR